VLASAIVAHTEQMRIGTHLTLLPLHGPVRMPDDLATLSNFSGSRFDLGVGIGHRQVGFEKFKCKFSHRPSLI
jgi:alkanesulfonate monooxygenase SsuD/methylene tetrahydromethanopterin reductase-like flavin-dependent oxidoreductase (luciferase family)